MHTIKFNGMHIIRWLFLVLRLNKLSSMFWELQWFNVQLEVQCLWYQLQIC